MDKDSAMEIFIATENALDKKFFTQHLQTPVYSTHFLPITPKDHWRPRSLESSCLIIDANLGKIPEQVLAWEQECSQIRSQSWIPKLFIIDALSESSLEHIISLKADDYFIRPLQREIVHAKLFALKRLKKERFALIEENKFLEQLSYQDPLTQLGNRRAFDNLFHTFENRDRPLLPQDHLTLLLIDIDNFKAFNDNYGHHYGDKALQILSQVMRETLLKFVSQSEGFITRYGGEEFALLLPDISSAQAEKIASSLLQAIESTPVPVGENKQGFLTVSIGYYCNQGKSETQQIMLEKADLALYHSKNNGRNRSCQYH